MINLWPKWFIAQVEKESLMWPAKPWIRWAFMRLPVRFEQIGGQKDEHFGDIKASFIMYATDITAQDFKMPDDFGVTHLNFKSRWGILRLFPFCLTVWWWWRMKKYDITGHGIPGSEFGPFLRIGKGRWVAGASKPFAPVYDKPTFYFGFHGD